jgi:branched-chain amino acid aminotransferase
VKVWLRGRLVDAEAAQVSVFDHGLTVGDAVFETVAVRQGHAIALTRHLQRLDRSAGALGLPMPDLNALRSAVEAVLDANSMSEGVLRILYTSGPGPLGSGRGDRAPTDAVLAGPPPHWSSCADVAVLDWPRNQRSGIVGVKTTSYAENVMALAEARRRGASEAVFPNLAGNLCEGSGSNVFLVHRGQLMTPPLSAGCLAGVSRALIIERLGIDVSQQDVPISALAEASEAFLTSATRDIQPIRSVDGTALSAAPGPQTRLVVDAYAALINQDPDPD